MDEINEEQQIMKQKNNKKKLIGIIAVIIIIAILAIALIGSDTISISRGVTMRELQLDFNNEDHDYRHYNDGDTVVLVDRITSLEIKTGISGNPITILEFSAKPLPEVELNTQTSPYSWDIVESSTEDWYTYDPFSSTPVKTTFDGDIAVLEDISDTYHVGDMVKITLRFKSVDVPGVWGNEPYTTEKIIETMPIIGGITADEIEKV